MPRLLRLRTLVALALMVTGLILVGCGVEAKSPRPTFAPTTTFVVANRPAEGDIVPVAAAPTATFTPLPPTSTSEPPTATPAPAETEAPTAEPTAESAMDTAALPGDPAVGEVLFNQVPSSQTQQMCITCHNPNEPLPGVGPYLYGIANVAGERIPGVSAVDYLFQSIINPNAFISPPQTDTPWPENLMPQSWRQDLGDDGVYHIVAYLMTLTQERSE